MNDRSIRPLGLPNGSVRAILALVIVVVACQQMLNGGAPSLLLAETLMIVLTYYFTARRHIHIDVEMRAKLEDAGVLLIEENPLWLPKGTVRGLIFAAFMLTVILLISQGRLLNSNVLTLLSPFAAYLFGALFHSNKPKDQAAQPGWIAHIFTHILALVVIFASVILLILAFNNILPMLPDWVASILLSTILYYFGTR